MTQRCRGCCMPLPPKRHGYCSNACLDRVTDAIIADAMALRLGEHRPKKWCKECGATIRWPLKFCPPPATCATEYRKAKATEKRAGARA